MFSFPDKSLDFEITSSLTTGVTQSMLSSSWCRSSSEKFLYLGTEIKEIYNVSLFYVLKEHSDFLLTLSLAKKGCI